MKCPRCGGDMSSGVCENCGFPVTVKRVHSLIPNKEKIKLMLYIHEKQ